MLHVVLILFWDDRLEAKKQRKQWVDMVKAKPVLQSERERAI